MDTQSGAEWRSADGVRWRLSRDGTLVVTVAGPLDPHTVTTTATRLRPVLAQAHTMTIGGAGLTAPDLTTVDLLARLLLIAGSARTEIRMQDTSPRLLQLLQLVGLDQHPTIVSALPRDTPPIPPSSG